MKLITSIFSLTCHPLARCQPIRVFFFLFGFLYFNILFSQENNLAIYFFKEDGSLANDVKSAAFFMHQVKENDTTYICKFYRKNGPLIKWETYLDSDLTTPNGRFAWYNVEGKLDSMGFTYRGKKDSIWEYKFNKVYKAAIQEEYSKGRFLRQKNYLTHTIRNANGTTEPMNAIDSISFLSSSFESTKNSKPASFKGGSGGWSRYLEGEIRMPESDFLRTFPQSKATVIISFFVSKEGKVSDLFIFQSQEYSLDMETIRLLKKSPDWIPALKNGQSVGSTLRQSITYGDFTTY